MNLADAIGATNTVADGTLNLPLGCCHCRWFFLVCSFAQGLLAVKRRPLHQRPPDFKTLLPSKGKRHRVLCLTPLATGCRMPNLP